MQAGVKLALPDYRVRRPILLMSVVTNGATSFVIVTAMTSSGPPAPDIEALAIHANTKTA
jgi:hypothetical protein